MTGQDADIVILGGGLAGGLIALALADLRPDIRVLLVEAGPRPGGNHVWSFFSADLPAGGDAVIGPMLAARWDHGYDVRFPGLARTLPSAYRSLTGERLAARLADVLPKGATLNGMAAEVTGPTTARLADGRVLNAGAVIDARGAAALPHLAGGWQKFAGQVLRTARPHGLTRPVVMDATVDQVEGYRFVYCLPFDENRVFVEDTYYADSPALDLPALRGRIAAYATVQGWDIAAIEGEETGVLPVVGRGDWRAFRQAQDNGAVLAGVRAGLFHPLTSYSLPTAMAFALDLAGQHDLSATGLSRWSRAWADDHWRRGAFYRTLVTMLFGAAAPVDRWRVLSRFYRLDAQLIERFYAGRSTMADKARILTGRPPVPLFAAVRALAGLAPLAPLEIAR
jgi:lycopene beta-cyclase